MTTILLVSLNKNVCHVVASVSLSHTAYTRPLVLRSGQITNSFHKLEIPIGPIAVTRFQADVVKYGDNDQTYVAVPTFDAYLHHHVVGSSFDNELSKTTTSNSAAKTTSTYSPMKPQEFSKAIGFGAGTECRGTPQAFPFPYAFITHPGQTTWIANVHVINTKGLEPHRAQHCAECPCTSENDFRKVGKSGLGLPWDTCNAELIQEKNTACFQESYKGGLRCCEDGQYCLLKETKLAVKDNTEDDLLDLPDTLFLRYTIEYDIVVPENKPLSLASCCDATGNLTNHGAVEYDLPECDEAIHPGCVHTISTIQHINTLSSSVFGASFSQQKTPTDKEVDDREIEIVYAVGHQHRSGLGISIYDAVTDNLLCSSVPTYGSGTDVLNEKGYIVSMSTCTFDPPIRMRSNDLVRIVSSYNNSVAHTGVMGLFYIAIHELPDMTLNEKDKPIMSLKHEMPVVATSSSQYGGFSFSLSAMFLVIVGTIVLFVVVKKVSKRNQSYRPLMDHHTNNSS